VEHDAPAVVVSDPRTFPNVWCFLEAVAIVANHLAIAAQLVDVGFVDVKHSTAILAFGIRIGVTSRIKAMDTTRVHALRF